MIIQFLNWLHIYEIEADTRRLKQDAELINSSTYICAVYAEKKTDKYAPLLKQNQYYC